MKFRLTQGLGCLLAASLSLTACGTATGPTGGKSTATVDPADESNSSTPGDTNTAGEDGNETPIDGGNTTPTDPNGAPFTKAEACHVASAEASLTRRPVDIIVTIDNSASMGDEAVALERNINQNFANILNDSGIDYRIILVAKHGSAARDESVCISAPLSGVDCSKGIPAVPAMTQRFFQYDIEVASTDPLEKLLATYNRGAGGSTPAAGWSTWLRPDAMKTFILITDDNSKISARAFDDALLALGGFGTVAKRLYTFHSIIGISENSPANAPWLPTQPAINTKCTTADRPGTVYEQLSIATGGLRFPVCQTESYDAVFKAAAQEVITGSQVSCEFNLPTPPQGNFYNRAYAAYTPGGSTQVEYLTLVESEAQCTPNNIFRNADNDRIALCPQACTRVTADNKARIEVAVTCASHLR